MEGLVSPISDSARSLLAPALRPDDRVLVLGAGGWFGSTVLGLLDGLVPSANVLAVAREPRRHRVRDVDWTLEAWNEGLVEQFSPTIVVNLAFVTRGYVATMALHDYERANAELTRRFLLAAHLPAVRHALTVSSGAAITEPEHPYGRMKLEEEQQALAAVARDRTMVVARAYSVSGALVRHPGEFAFSSFVEQAAAGHIAINAERPTFRRYCDVSELLAVCLRRGLDGWSGVIESGGGLVEMGELAQLIADATGPSVTISRARQVTDVPSVYASDDLDWQQHCAALGFNPGPIAEQVARAVHLRSVRDAV